MPQKSVRNGRKGNAAHSGQIGGYVPHAFSELKYKQIFFTSDYSFHKNIYMKSILVFLGVSGRAGQRQGACSVAIDCWGAHLPNLGN